MTFWNKNFGKRALHVLRRVVVAIVLLCVAAIVVTSISPIYDFKEARPFSGPNIYNPYADFDSLNSWKRANFHTHTRVEGFNNECDYWPAEVLATYESLGYDIVTFSNHNEQTSHPKGEAFQSNGYEHGYNLAKFHKLVFGAEKVWRFDNLLPIFPFQKQMQLDRLAAQSDIVVLNHPLRTHTMTDGQLSKIGGYDIIELDSGKSTENEYWDAALSAGRYSFGVANDDLHHPERSHAIAVRSNMLCTPSSEYSDICRTLLSGCFYAMRTPDYGGGKWDVKAEKNRSIPYVNNIGVTDCGEIFVTLSNVADSIKVTGQNHTTLAVIENADSLGYAMLPADSYGRFTAYFSDGEVIYTNPFARYDAEVSASPFNTAHSVNIALTILYNAAVVAFAALLAFLLYKTAKL